MGVRRRETGALARVPAFRFDWMPRPGSAGGAAKRGRGSTARAATRAARPR